MWGVTNSGKPDNGDGDEVPPELCDLCGTVVSDETELYGLVPDSSAVHAHEAKFDGKRMIVACSPEHLAELREQYRRRPFVDEELWAGKIVRAVRAHPGISAEELTEETGLAPDRIERAVAWQNAQSLEWREKYGPNDNNG